MTIDVDPDWWKTLFDEVYLMTDARSIGDAAITRQEIDIFTSLVPMQPHDRILDLCGGQGRHALELCRRGFRDCTVLDYSQSLIDIGKREAVDQCRSVQFMQGDARHTSLAPRDIRSCAHPGQLTGLHSQSRMPTCTSCKESLRLLKPHGWLLLDVTDGAAACKTLAPLAWHEIGDDVVVCRQREVRRRPYLRPGDGAEQGPWDDPGSNLLHPPIHCGRSVCAGRPRRFRRHRALQRRVGLEACRRRGLHEPASGRLGP